MDSMVSSTAEFLKSQVPDWEEDNEVSTARFKAFSGQRCDWEDKFQFWRRLIISLARHLGRIIIDSDEVRNKWFARQGLVPLCLNDVLSYRSKSDPYAMLFICICGGRNIVELPCSGFNLGISLFVVVSFLILHIILYLSVTEDPDTEILVFTSIKVFLAYKFSLICILLLIFISKLEMYRNGDLAKPSYFDDMSNSRFHWVFNLASWIGITTADASEQCERKYIVLQLLQEKADQITRSLNETCWSSFCVMTIERFQDYCGGSEEASVLIGYLIRCKRAQHIKIKNNKCIHGIKISVEPKTTITSVSEFDCDMLHLQWIQDKLQSQLDVIEKRYEAVSDLAIKEAKTGHKQAALRHLRNKKVAFARKEKCQGFIDKVEEILRVIADAESTKKVVEAIKVGAQCLKEHSLDIEEIHAGIDGLDEAIASQKHLEEFLESMPVAATEIEDRELEHELAELELELEPIGGLVEKSIPGLKPQHSAASNKTETLEMADSVCQKLSKLELEPS